MRGLDAIRQWLARSPLKYFRLALARSLVLRVAVQVMVVGMVSVLALIIFATSWVRSDLLRERLDAVIADADTRVATAQSQMDATAVNTTAEVSALAQSQVTSLKDAISGANGVGVVLMRSRSSNSAIVINDLSSTSGLRQAISNDLITQLESNPHRQYWQYTKVTDNGKTVPGIVVASQLTLPLAGTYNVFLVYSLKNEQHLLDIATRALVWGGSVLVVAMGVVVALLTWRVLLPVRRTSLAAQRLAAGNFGERLEIKSQDEAASLALSFNNMADSIEAQIDRLSELSRLQQRFVSDVSHELRTPMTTILLAGEALFDARDKFSDPRLKRSTELLYGQIERFDKMLADLLEISRFDAGSAALSLQEWDVGEIARDVIDFAQPLAQANGCQIRLHIEGNKVTAVVDHTRIERILRNLVVNATEHGEGKPIDINVVGDDTAVAVRVRDHGIGMSEEVAEHVFDRFYRADPSRARKSGGTGLGLSISREDAALHNGTLSAWGWPGDGAAFLLLIPRNQDVPAGRGPLDVIPPDAPLEALVKDVAGHMGPNPEPVPTPSLGLPLLIPATRWADEEEENDAS